MAATENQSSENVTGGREAVAAYLNETLVPEIDKQIKSLGKRARFHSQRAKYFHVGGAVSSFAAAVALGLNVGNVYADAAINTALILTLLGGFLKSVEGFSNHKELWFRYTVTTNRLRSLRRDAVFVSAKRDVDETDRLHVTFKQILEESNESWEELRSRNNSPRS